MAIPQKKPHVTVEEYLILEREAEDKSGYYNGEIFAMAGASRMHCLISSNAIRELGNRLRGKGCTPYGSDLRIEIPATGLFTYPDVSVICEPSLMSAHDAETATNPTLILEVLSDSTEAYDRGGKFANYRALTSFREYVLVSQKEPLVEVFFRHDDGTWQLTPITGLGATARLQSLNIELPLAEIYYNVQFPEPTPLKPVAS